MTLTKLTPSKLAWLLSMPTFRRDPLGVAWRVMAWEVFRLLHRPVRYAYDEVFEVTLQPNEGASRLAYYFGVTEPELFAFYERFLAPGMVVVDAGANIGLHSLFFSRRITLGGAVYAFEPDPGIFDRLVSHVKQNVLGQIKCFNVALGATPGFAEVVRDDADTSRTSVRLAEAPQHASVARVPIESLDNFATRERVEKIDFLKVDVEGFEAEILRGAMCLLREGRIGVLQVEIDSKSLGRAGSCASSVLGLLEEAGYQLAFWDSRACVFRPGVEVAYNSFFVRVDTLANSAAEP